MNAGLKIEDMPPKPLPSSLIPYLVIASLLLCFYSTFLTSPQPPLPPSPSSSSSSCDLFRGKRVYNPWRPKTTYDETCPFHRNAWNCIKNGKPDMGKVNSWEWVPKGCDLERFDARGFLGSMRERTGGFIGDSLSENVVVALLCALLLAKYRQRRLPLLVITDVMDFIEWKWISLLMIRQTSASFTISLYLTLATGGVVISFRQKLLSYSIMMGNR